MDINTCLATTESYRNLALYSHLIPALAIFVLGLFAYLRAPSRTKAIYFFCFAAAFTAWLISDLIVWTSNSYDLVAAFWEPLDYIEITAFIFLFLFICSDILREKVPVYLVPLLVFAAIPPFWITVTGDAVQEMYQPMCEMVGNDFLAHYKVWFEGFILSATLLLSLFKIISSSTDRTEKIRIALVTLPVVLFMGVFAGSEYVATASDIFEINLYALFVLPLLVLMLTIAITSYGTFKLGDATVKVLFFVFLILAGTQFFFVSDMVEFLLASMSFAVVLTLGTLLFRSNEREIQFRQQLEIANQQQETLLHFISHEIKGYLTKGQNAFAGIVEGDYGPVPPKTQEIAATALGEMRKGVSTVMDILDASNLKKGTMAYKKEKFDIAKAVAEVCSDLTPTGEKKGLTITCALVDEPIPFTGDEEKIKRHIIRNLLDNSIKYTPSGSVSLSLEHTDRVIRFTVQDTGVGITKEDMQKLFTEGGHGKESIKVNVDSTGYGLFVAKEVTEGHGGKIWAESEGAGKGSRFIVELPIA